MPRHLKTAAGVPTANGFTTSAPKIVESVIDRIRSEGDSAVRQFSDTFDKWSPTSFKLSRAEIEAIIAEVSKQTIEDIKEVQNNVRAFARAQRDSLKDFELEIRPGVHLGQKNIPISAVGCYIPGDRYPLLASAHMTILTAKVAGVPHVIACTPPIAGEIPKATVAAMHLAGADEIFILGDVQAVAAMAIGTNTIRKVDFIAGPGNAFVAEAKRQLFGSIGIDLFAGLTEVLIVADDAADPFMCATDLLSQVEHGSDTSAVLITTSEEKAFGEVVVVVDLDEAYALADEYASEHVQILTQNPRDALAKMQNYGALFLGANTCVSYGDKVIGANHVLPTRKAARYTGGLWVGKYLGTVTYQEVTSAEESGKLGRLCGRAARAENFEGHARSGDLRANRFLHDDFDWIFDHPRDSRL